MKIPTNELSCQVLFLQAADGGRDKTLFGEKWNKTCDTILPLVENVPFPTIYLECPLAGETYLDATVLFDTINIGTRFSSNLTAGTEQMIDWYAQTKRKYTGISFGYELDSASKPFAPAAVHFQHRNNIELSQGFMEAIGKPEMGRLYLDLAARMPKHWALSFLGIFRGRSEESLRVCGYLKHAECIRCARDTAYLEDIFRKVGFSAYDERMLRQVSAFFATIPDYADFQFDLFSDGRIGDTFGIDAHIGQKHIKKIKESFNSGGCANTMKLLESWGAADSRWKHASEICLSNSLPVEDEFGNLKDYAILIKPAWVKARWRGAEVQKAKLYCEGKAKVI